MTLAGTLYTATIGAGGGRNTNGAASSLIGGSGSVRISVPGGGAGGDWASGRGASSAGGTGGGGSGRGSSHSGASGLRFIDYGPIQ